MIESFIHKFKKDLEGLPIPSQLNNPFASGVSGIAELAVSEFQQIIALESPLWDHDFKTQKGKMFGVLVVQKEDASFGYLGAISGYSPSHASDCKFVPSIFDDSIDDYFINRGMRELTALSAQIKDTSDQKKIEALREVRRHKSLALQKRLFENYHILNIHGREKSVLEIFADFSNTNPPSAAGECAAPKLLQYALKQGLKPLALAEFWWGKSPKNQERKHLHFYPACKNKCRPILEYMLDDPELYTSFSL